MGANTNVVQEPARLRPLAADRYDDFRPVGQGGMGIVYWAIDRDLNREVAFKVVRPTTPEVGLETPRRPTDLTPLYRFKS